MQQTQISEMLLLIQSLGSLPDTKTNIKIRFLGLKETNGSDAFIQLLVFSQYSLVPLLE